MLGVLRRTPSESFIYSHPQYTSATLCVSEKVHAEGHPASRVGAADTGTMRDEPSRSGCTLTATSNGATSSNRTSHEVPEEEDPLGQGKRRGRPRRAGRLSPRWPATTPAHDADAGEWAPGAIPSTSPRATRPQRGGKPDELGRRFRRRLPPPCGPVGLHCRRDGTPAGQQKGSRLLSPGSQPPVHDDPAAQVSGPKTAPADTRQHPASALTRKRSAELWSSSFPRQC